MRHDDLHLQFPKIYRFIPELPSGLTLFHLKIFLVSFVSGFLLIAISLKGYTLMRALNQIQANSLARVQLLQERSYWEDVSSRHQGYRDAYFKVALLSYQLGDLTTTKTYLQKTLTTDPMFGPAKAFAKRIGEE
jgi:hypothetical protein